MRLIITKDVGKWAATYVKEKMKRIDITDQRNFVLGLPTGGTAVDMYKNFIEMYKRKEISFKNVTTFNMDEYVGLPEEHKESYHTYMNEHLFKHVDMDPAKINIPNGNAPDIAAECLDYERRITDAGGIDIFVGGVGENGHIAFNEPYSSMFAGTNCKQLSENTIIANSRFFGGDLSQVPKKAMTIGIRTLMESAEVMIMVMGDKKALALQQCMEGAISQAWPITALQMHTNAIIVADEAACGELKMKTYRYFTELEDEYTHIL